MPPVNGVGKPCAGEPHARIDGRELETEQPGHGHDEERPRRKPRWSSWRCVLPPTTATAPAPDPPPDWSFGAGQDKRCLGDRADPLRAQADAAERLPPGLEQRDPAFTRGTQAAEEPVAGQVVPRAEAKSSDDPLTWADITVRRLRHDAQRLRLVGGRTAGSL
jgi:hypothetical protein